MRKAPASRQGLFVVWGDDDVGGDFPTQSAASAWCMFWCMFVPVFLAPSCSTMQRTKGWVTD
jgi:hypothetical protein